jgi:hypothetical protein
VIGVKSDGFLPEVFGFFDDLLANLEHSLTVLHHQCAIESFGVGGPEADNFLRKCL